MATPNIIDVCRADLFTRESELQERYPQVIVDKVLRIREMYNWFISNPDGTDREFVAEVVQRHGVHRTTDVSKAYRRGKAASKVKLHSQEMMLAQVGSPLAIENAHRNLLDMEDDE